MFLASLLCPHNFESSDAPKILAINIVIISDGGFYPIKNVTRHEKSRAYMYTYNLTMFLDFKINHRLARSLIPFMQLYIGNLRQLTDY